MPPPKSKSIPLRHHSFPPVALPDARVLILGSMPGVESLRRQQYYAHPRNGFWPILGGLLGFDPGLPYAARTARLAASGIALWDVLASCERQGSLDAHIRQGEANDFLAFFRCHPRIRVIFFNGSTAATLFRRRVWPELSREFPHLELCQLPSTSPAHAGLSLKAKLEAWKTVAEKAREEGTKAQRHKGTKGNANAG